ncbi:MAG TPA: DUF362 domain-containing protein [Bryobacteraceae bacterium]|nr:DUF362 domain-containing protein [Bryobacteraceae bacterium]
MPCDFSRRQLFYLAGMGTAGRLAAQQAPAAESQGLPVPVLPVNSRSAVSLVKGEERRKIVCEALEAIDDQIRPVLKRKKYVIIKPNNVSTVRQLAATHADTVRGILDYLAPRFKGPVVIAESSAGATLEGFENFGYNKVATEHRSQRVKLVDLNQEALYKVIPLVNYDVHPIPVRLAARLMDPDAYTICAAILKTHNAVIATLSVKNMTLGAPLHQPPGETSRWNDKRKYHEGVRVNHYNMMLTAQALKPYWGATLIDGFEGMEGNGPSSGTPVASRIAIASTDYIAADRIGVEAMGINPAWVGYLNFCWQVGLGQYDLAKIDVRGAKLEDVRRQYRLHNDIERQLEWMGPMRDLPPKLG